MQVFIYEFITGGGLLSSPDHAPPAASLLREGAAMVCALAEDFASLRDVDVTLLRDARLTTLSAPTRSRIIDVADASEELQAFRLAAASSEWTIVIAPEFDQHLLRRVRLVDEVGGRLLGPPPQLVQLATDKHAAANHFATRGLPTPRGCIVHPGWRPCEFRFPAVLKPTDGAGSVGVQYVDDASAVDGDRHQGLRLEEYHDGTPASVAVLCGPTSTIVLPPGRQLMSEDGAFSYLGGLLPLNEPLRSRAARLAQAAVETLPSSLGYLGIDLVLGENEADDVIIEVNPRLTTSYVGLRETTRQTLAEAMLRLANGETTELCFDEGPIEFSADGTIITASRTRT